MADSTRPAQLALLAAVGRRYFLDGRSKVEIAEEFGFLTAAGEPVKADLTKRTIGIDAEHMRAIPDVIVIAFGMAKAPAPRAALRSGLVGGVVTHTALAQALLDAA